MRHAPGVLDERLDRTERFREREHARSRDQLDGSLLTTAHEERDHASEAAHLTDGGGVTGVMAEPRVHHPLDRGVLRQQRGHRRRVLAMAIHAHAQCLEPAQHEVAIEGRRHRTRCVLEEPELLGPQVVVEREESTDHIGVTAEVLRRRVHDDVGAFVQR